LLRSRFARAEGLLAAVLVAGGALAAPMTAAASRTAKRDSNANGIFVPAPLLSRAQAAGDQRFDVIVEARGGETADTLADRVAQFAAQGDAPLAAAAQAANDAAEQAQTNANALAAASAKADRDAADAAASGSRDAPKKAADAAKARDDATAAQALADRAQQDAGTAAARIADLADRILRQQVDHRLSSISAVSASLTGDQVESLVQRGDGDVLAITPDAPAVVSGSSWSSAQIWPRAADVLGNWNDDSKPGADSALPTIAIVDSGVADRTDFGSRLLASVDLGSLPDDSPGDGRGHGTFVAGIAAGAATGYAGASPAARLVSVDVMNDEGVGRTSDVIAACQWILANKDRYGIRVANFSLQSAVSAPFFIDPLDRAVEQLWQNGIVVVAAAGNDGVPGSPSGVLYSPADDPFVVTVGAADLNGSARTNDDTIAPWSSWGYTMDGFAKPELSAPGRYMVGPTPIGSTLWTERPGNVFAPGYMQLSGTSFAAPVVAGAAADILARHPGFTPDQVKGALMLTAQNMDRSVGLAGGVGEVSASRAANRPNAPNPNLALDAFVTATGGFDWAAWMSAAQASPSWNSASWNSASWNSASLNSASWNSASWNSASWNSASWNSASWNSASWNSASWNSASHADAAEGDALPPDAFAAWNAEARP
jgi:serine protease AprX